MFLSKRLSSFSKILLSNYQQKCLVSSTSQLSLASKSPISQETSDFFQNANPLKQEIQHDIDNGPAYENHIPLSPIQWALLTIGSGYLALNDPYRDDSVATFGEVTGYYALKKMHQQMLNNPEGRRILENQPRIHSTTIDLEGLKELPSNTFGYVYYYFLKECKISPDSRRPVRFVDDPELAYVCQRYREVHDLVHCILSMPTNMLGEVIVKWVEAIQTGLPMCWFGGLFGAIKLTPKAREIYVKEGLPWALKCGHQAKPFMCVYFEERFEQDFEDLRRELNIPKPPVIPKLKSHIKFVKYDKI